MSQPGQMQCPPERTWWVIWFALLTSPFIFSVVLSSIDFKIPALPIPWQIALIPFVIGCVVRWVAIPRAPDGGWAFALFVLGLSGCEAPAVIGAVLFPDVKRELFALSILGIAQFVPTFAKRFFISK
jgi:hypothetical protein